MKYDIKIRKRIAIILCCFLFFSSNFAIGCGTDKNSGEPAACIISIDCRAVLDNMDDLKETKKEFIPFFSQMSFKISNTVSPVVNSTLVDERINQLYEFDCGKKSGWMYSVNGVFPNYGASSYKPKDGERLNGCILAISETM